MDKTVAINERYSVEVRPPEKRAHLHGPIALTSFGATTYLTVEETECLIADLRRGVAEIQREPKTDSFSMVVDQVETITGRGTVLIGKVGSGRPQTGMDMILLQPNGDLEVACRGVESMGDRNRVGDSVGILLGAVDPRMISVGATLMELRMMTASEWLADESEVMGPTNVTGFSRYAVGDSIPDAQ